MVKRKDGSWQEKIRLKDGKYKYFYGKTKAEVIKKLQSFKEEKERGVLFRDVAERWREEHEATVVPTTYQGYSGRYNRALERFGDMPIASITSKDVFDLLERLKREQFSKKTVSTQKNVLNMIFNFAILQGEITVNPCTAVSLPSGLSKKKRQLPTNEELQIVENSDWLFPFFLLYTGCRRGEALAVTYEDIDWEKKIIHINKAVGYKKHIPYIKSTKTEAGERDVILLDKLAKRLPKKKHGLIFPNSKGKVWYESVIDKKWQKWRDDNGITLTAHQLRHGYATILFEAGLEVKDAQYLLGHSSASITQDVYTHIRKERQERNAEKLNAYLNSNVK